MTYANFYRDSRELNPSLPDAINIKCIHRYWFFRLLFLLLGVLNMCARLHLISPALSGSFYLRTVFSNRTHFCQKNIDLLQLACEKVNIRELNKYHIWLYQSLYFKNHSLSLKIVLQNFQNTTKTKTRRVQKSSISVIWLESP